MEKLNILTGEVQCPVFKKMCLNCDFCLESENETYVCNNEENKAAAVEKLKAALPEGYEIENLELKPRPLKAVIKKCGKWTLNKKAVWEAVQNCFEE